MGELTSLSAVEMAAGIQRRKFSPVDLVEAHLSRIDHLNPRLNAFVTVDREGAREAAKDAEAALERGDTLGVLHGVPLTIKSSIDVAGYRCEAGTPLRAGNIPPADAPVVSRLRAAGAILLGNTNAPEFLMAYETDNPLHGRTNNPWDLERTPGGSSGGEAAAIAARCSAGGMGSDGGGSIRIPAHFSGICGLKPTPGRIPATGHFPPSAGPFASLGVVGPMARTINDLALLFEVLAGPDTGDSNAAPVPVRWRGEAELRRFHIGYFESDGRVPVTPETRAAVRAAAAALEEQEFEVDAFRPAGLEDARRLWWTLFGPAGSMVLGPLLAGHEDHEDEVGPILREFMGIVAAEPPLALESFMDTLLKRDEVRAHFLAQMDVYPVLLCPVCAVPAFRHRERAWTVGGKTVGYLDAMSYTQWFNLLGNPAVVVPVGRSPEGLPIGVQVVGRPHEEEVVLAIAAKIERACHDRREPSL
jgi:Asp-tRNA(Asn)/Glu-tRNA(Gln) amidotransferase A subunit family amidase